MRNRAAAAVALTGLTALSAIEDTLKLKRGETILIQGGAGGVAGFAIQLAKHIGAHVITTASAVNHAYARSLGADEVIGITFVTSQRWCPTAMRSSIRSAAMSRRGVSPCSSQAAAPLSLPRAHRLRSRHVETSHRCGRRSGAREGFSNRLRNSSCKEPCGHPRSSSIGSPRRRRRIA